MNARDHMDFPELDEISAELKRLGHKRRYRHSLRSTIGTLLVVAALAVLIATLFLPVMRVTGTSMEPNLVAGDIIIGFKDNRYQFGQVCSFYFNNKLVLKRVIGTPGDWIDIDERGVVYLNNVPLEEPYVSELSKGICDIALPYQVPEGRVFVMGDNRETSVDSRSTALGCVAIDEIVGRVLVRVWPLDKLSYLGNNL